MIRRILDTLSGEYGTDAAIAAIFWLYVMVGATIVALSIIAGWVAAAREARRVRKILAGRSDKVEKPPITPPQRTSELLPSQRRRLADIGEIRKQRAARHEGFRRAADPRGRR